MIVSIIDFESILGTSGALERLKVISKFLDCEEGISTYLQPHTDTEKIVSRQRKERALTKPGKFYVENIPANTAIANKEDLIGNWTEESNCRGVDPDLFFPERGVSTREAKDVCRGCIVRLECLEYSLENGEKFGIWGGLSERERRRLRRQRALAARKVTA